ncbi:MAG: formylmethanofuran dehydrogenase subunit B [Candidatus Helarchaeota archaeon]
MGDLQSNVVCTGCSLLCDDIVVELENGKIKTTHHVCARGYGRYYQIAFKYRLLSPLKRINGKQQEISYEDAIQETIDLLKKAKNPFFYGWASTTSEAQQKGIQLAQKFKAGIDCATNSTTGIVLQQLNAKNIQIPQLEDIKDNADLLLFWGCNPTASHIRLLSKFALLPRGANTDRGIEDRVAISVDIRKTDMTKFSEEILQIEPGEDKALLEALIQIIQGKSLTEDIIANIPRKTIYNVANIIKEANFGVLFFGNGYAKTQENMDTLLRFFETVNQKGIKIGAVPLDGGYNAVGFNLNLKKHVNLELNADFQSSPPTQTPNFLIESLKQDKIDLLVVIGADPISNLPFHVCKLFAKIPIICIDYQQTPTTKVSHIVIPTTIPGVESAGTAYRLDYKPITLKKILEPPEGIYSDEEILNALLEQS